MFFTENKKSEKSMFPHLVSMQREFELSAKKMIEIIFATILMEDEYLATLFSEKTIYLMIKL